MKVLSLHCAQEHDFEGWFANEAAYEGQLSLGLVQCPVCGDKQIKRLPTAAHLKLSRAPSAAANASAREIAPTRSDIARDMEAMWLSAVREVIAQTQDVGQAFADEAKKMHFGEAEQRAIRGQASEEQLRELREENIEVHTLLIPKGLKETLQ